MTSSFPETESLVSAGFDDILYGYPLLETHMERNFDLRRRLDAYHMFVTNMESVEVLRKWAPPQGKKWCVGLSPYSMLENIVY